MVDEAARRAELVERFRRLQTAVVCDVHDEMDWAPRALHPDIKALSGDGTPLVGFAATVVGRLERFSGPDRRKLAFADGLSAHDVAVWSGTDAGGFCLFGDLIAASMQRAGAAGAIVDGGFRDRDAIHATGFPVHARFVTPLQGLGRWRVVDEQVPVTLASAYGEPVLVRPGDLVFADGDGVVIVEQERIQPVLERAEAIIEAEAEARRLSAEGMTAQDMLDRFGHV